MAGWTLTELADKLDLKPQTVSGWISAGLVQPEHRRRGRQGHEIGVAGLMELLTVAELRRVGFSTREIKRAVENLRALSGRPRPLAAYSLIIHGNDLAWASGPEVEGHLISVLRCPGQRLMLFPMGEWHRQLVDQLEADAEQARSTTNVTSTLK